MNLALFLQQNQQFDPAQLARLISAMAAFFLVAWIVGMVVVIVPFWFICKKAGFSPWLSLLNVVPLGGLILWYVLAFADWKVGPMAQGAYPPTIPYPPQPPYPPQS